MRYEEEGFCEGLGALLLPGLPSLKLTECLAKPQSFREDFGLTACSDRHLEGYSKTIK